MDRIVRFCGNSNPSHLSGFEPPLKFFLDEAGVLLVVFEEVSLEDFDDVRFEQERLFVGMMPRTAEHTPTVDTVEEFFS